MNNTLLAVLAVSAAGFFSTAHANPTFNEANSQLTLPTVVVGNTLFNNVVVRIDRFAVISVGSSGSAPNIKETCVYSDFTTAKYNAIQVGMTVGQINQIMGCKFDPTQTVRSQTFVGYYWVSSGGGPVALIMVTFDATGSTAQGGSFFKTSAGF